MAEGALYDMHCHLGFCADPAATVGELAMRGVAGGLCCTVAPEEFEQVAPLIEGRGDWRVGVGLHPWWVSELDETDIDHASRLVSQGPCLVGELGLDFGRAHETTRTQQLAAFTCILDAIRPGSVLSLHAVRSADVVLDLLEERGLTQSCACILHWFSGTSSELHRAVQLGCHFSVGPLMLRSRRGREYARQLPLPQLLLETDYPDRSHPKSPQQTAREIAQGLTDACGQVATLRNTEPAALAETLASRSRLLLDQLT